jgi:hypothetical protein
MLHHRPRISISWIINLHCVLLLICFSEIPSTRHSPRPFASRYRVIVSAFLVSPLLRTKQCFPSRPDDPQRRFRSTETVIRQQEKDADTPSVSSAANDANTTSARSAQTEEQKRIEELQQEAKQIKVGELRSLLEANGVSTKIFLEKSEFVQAYVKMKMNPEASSSKGQRSASSSSSRGTDTRRTSEARDPSYRDVVVYKMNRGDPRLLQGGTVIDVRISP